MTTQRLLATTVWALTLGIVVCVEITIARTLMSDHSDGWLFLAASAVVAIVSAGYVRFLSRWLHRNDRPRWRLTRAEATPLLPVTLAVFWLAVGVATSTYWPDWLGSAIGGCAVAALTDYGLKRSRTRV